MPRTAWPLRDGQPPFTDGREAALLTAAHDDRVAAVVSVVGSGIVTKGIDFQRGNLREILRPA